MFLLSKMIFYLASARYIDSRDDQVALLQPKPVMAVNSPNTVPVRGSPTTITGSPKEVRPCDACATSLVYTAGFNWNNTYQTTGAWLDSGNPADQDPAHTFIYVYPDQPADSDPCDIITYCMQAVGARYWDYRTVNVFNTSSTSDNWFCGIYYGTGASGQNFTPDEAAITSWLFVNDAGT